MTRPGAPVRPVATASDTRAPQAPGAPERGWAGILGRVLTVSAWRLT